MDEFWIEPLAMDGEHATIRACFNEFTVTILIERKDGQPISKSDAQAVCNAVVSRVSPTR